MKVLLLSGSPHAHGNTAQLIELCAAEMRNAGIEPIIESLSDKKIEACGACGQCKKLGRCAIEDGLNEIIDKLRECDGFIVASPVYFGTARGDVMCALQRMGMVSMSSDRFLTGKVGGPIAVARRGGHTLTLQEMLMFFLINDMIVVGSTYWNMVFGRLPGEAMNDEEGVATIRHFAANVAGLVKRLHAAS